MRNIDLKTVDGFGKEWSAFDQSILSEAERVSIFDNYFSIFPWESLPRNAVGADIGCGSGRWAILMARRVGTLHCVDPSEKALAVAAFPNVYFHEAGVDALPFPDGSMDFAFSLGALHHVPDTGAAISSVARILKSGAPFLVYLYYRFDNRPLWFRILWSLSDLVRRVVARLPFGLRYWTSQVLAIGVYFPVARTCRAIEKLGFQVDGMPLAFYRDKSLYVMRTDALDRFGTQLEQRFTRRQILEMLVSSGFTDVRFSEGPPFWCAVGYRR